VIDAPELRTRRLVLRPLVNSDYAAWAEVRTRNEDWLVPWEPAATPGRPDVVQDPRAFASRCGARAREQQLGTAYAFGIFVGGAFAGEVNLSSIRRGPLQSGDIGYWIDQARAGNSYMSEAVAAVIRFGFEQVRLHRIEIDIIPRNHRSLRVVEKLGLRQEGLAERLVEINGVWEDHYRFAITSEEWPGRKGELESAWLEPAGAEV
jgi:ribosomal-protein-alanine N-acetyltransferase